MLLLSVVAVAAADIHIDKDPSLFGMRIVCISMISVTMTIVCVYPLFNNPIEVKCDTILLYKKPPKYSQYPPKQYLYDIETHNYANNEIENNTVAKKGKIKCYFYTKYYDTKRSQLVDFQCDEDALIKGFCIFHEDDAKDKENELDNTLNEKINKLIDEGQRFSV